MKTGHLWIAAGLLAGVSSCAGRAAHADVSWEHTFTLRITKFKQPVARFKMYSNYTAQRSRLLLKYDLSGLSQVGMPPGAMFPPTPAGSTATRKPPFPLYGGVALIQRYDDDHFVAYATHTRAYTSGTMSQLAKRLRFDPWKKLAPKLSEEAPPELTVEQRQRLGAEVRAATQPYLSKVLHAYFHSLPATRNFDGIEARGHRLTLLVNAGAPSHQGQQWLRLSMEMWLAPDLPGDEALREFRKTAMDETHRRMWQSTSMWYNEMMPVLWQTMPVELHHFVETLVPPPSSPNAGFGGTPLRIYYTVSFPPLQRQIIGDVREEVVLTRRDTTPLRPEVFDAPASYKYYPLEPQLKKFEEMMKTGRPEIPTLTDQMGFTWQAWNDYKRATKSLTPQTRRSP
jgi:hypothetical protein